jgi:bile acid:Na+ symporter, BASS family
LKDLVIEILKIVAPLSVALIVFAQGLRTRPSKVLTYFRDQPLLLLRSIATTLVLVPAAALALLLVLKPAHSLAVGLAILVSCPPAPMMLKSATEKGGGSAAFMACLHLTLAVLAFLTVPATLRLLSIPLDFNAEVHLGEMTWILARTILLPIGFGLVVHAFFPVFAEKAGQILGRVGTIGLLAVVLFAAVALYPALLNMNAQSYLVIVIVAVVALAIGHLLGPSNPRERTDLAAECAVRHPMLALAIAGTALSPEIAMPVLVPCVITFVLIATIYLIWQGKRQAAG